MTPEEALARRLAEVAGKAGKHRVSLWRDVAQVGDVNFDVDVVSPTQVRMHLYNVSPEQAEQILTLLAR